jgi:hypothetical protein
MDEEIAEAIGSLLGNVRETFVTMEKLGSSILNELERTEQEVTQSWGKYLNAKSPSAAPLQGGRSDEDCGDPWVSRQVQR